MDPICGKSTFNTSPPKNWGTVAVLPDEDIDLLDDERVEFILFMSVTGLTCNTIVKVNLA